MLALLKKETFQENISGECITFRFITQLLNIPQQSCRNKMEIIESFTGFANHTLGITELHVISKTLKM